MRHAAAAALALVLISCKGAQVDRPSAPDTSASAKAVADSIPATAWDAVASARVYFGHQSVGRSIVEALKQLGQERGGHALTIIHSRDRGIAGGPALVEFPIGENGHPETKFTDFGVALQQVADSGRGIALFEYCFLDVTGETDVQQLFAQHRAAIQAMRASHPNLTFVHMTAALTADEPTWRYMVKRVLGRQTTRSANMKRNELNALLRREYAGEPFFDLARVESTRPDGTRSFFRAGNDTIYTLAAELTSDGGHLNSAGARSAARELTNALAATLNDSKAGTIAVSR